MIASLQGFLVMLMGLGPSDDQRFQKITLILSLFHPLSTAGFFARGRKKHRPILQKMICAALVF
jgi:hypothetical protein